MYLFYNFLFSFFTSFLLCIVSTYSHISRFIHALYYSFIETETNNQDSTPPPLALGLGPVCRKKRKKKKEGREKFHHLYSHTLDEPNPFISLIFNPTRALPLESGSLYESTRHRPTAITSPLHPFFSLAHPKSNYPPRQPTQVQSSLEPSSLFLFLSLSLSPSLSLSLSLSLL